MGYGWRERLLLRFRGARPAESRKEVGWEDWFVGYSVRSVRNSLYLIDEKEVHDLVMWNLQKSPSVSVLDWDGYISQKPLTRAVDDSRLMGRSTRWVSVEQLHNIPVHLPAKWRDNPHFSNRGARYTRIWQFLQLAAICGRVAYVGNHVEGLYNDPNATHFVFNHTPIAMHDLTMLCGRDCRWKLNEGMVTLTGIINLSSKYDLVFSAVYQLKESSVVLAYLGRTEGSAGDAIYRRTLFARMKDLQTTSVELSPRISEINERKYQYDIVTIPGVWGKRRKQKELPAPAGRSEKNEANSKANSEQKELPAPIRCSGENETRYNAYSVSSKKSMKVHPDYDVFALRKDLLHLQIAGWTRGREAPDTCPDSKPITTRSAAEASKQVGPSAIVRPALLRTSESSYGENRWKTGEESAAEAAGRQNAAHTSLEYQQILQFTRSEMQKVINVLKYLREDVVDLHEEPKWFLDKTMFRAVALTFEQAALTRKGRLSSAVPIWNEIAKPEFDLAINNNTRRVTNGSLNEVRRWIAEEVTKVSFDQPMTVIVNGGSFDADILIKRKTQFWELVHNERRCVTGDPLYLILNALVDIPCEPENWTSTALAHGLEGFPAAHIETADLLLEELMERSLGKLDLGFGKIASMLHEMRWGLFDYFLNEAGSSTGVLALLEKNIMQCRIASVFLAVSLQSIALPIIMKRLMAITMPIPRSVVTLAQKLCENDTRLHSLYLDSKFFPQENGLRIKFIEREFISGYEVGEKSVGPIETSSYKPNVVLMDIRSGAVLSDVLSELNARGVYVGDVIYDMVPYLDAEKELGSWARSMLRGHVEGRAVPIIEVDQPIVATLPSRCHGEIQRVSSFTYQDVQCALYHTQSEIEGLSWPGEDTFNPNDIIVLLGGWLSRQKIRRRTKRQLRETGTNLQVYPTGSDEQLDFCDLNWVNWFVGYKLIVIENEMVLVHLQDNDRLLEEKRQTINGTVGANTPLGGGNLGGSITYTYLPISPSQFHGRVCMNDIKWRRVEQLYSLAIFVPRKWSEYKQWNPRRARYSRIYQFLQLMGLVDGVVYRGKNLSGLIPNDEENPIFVVENSTPFAMHDLQLLRGLDCKWVRDGDRLTLQGLLDLSGDYDLCFTSESVLQGLSQKVEESSGTLSDSVYQNTILHLLEKVEAKVTLSGLYKSGSITPASEDPYQRVTIGGIWASSERDRGAQQTLPKRIMPQQILP